MITDQQYHAHPKVKQAHKLLIQAWQELRLQEMEQIDAALCECGHRRDKHGPRYSINFTGGACGFCDCLNFLKE